MTISFVRLTEVAIPSILELLNEPRNARHMPLASEFTAAQAADWVRAKDGQREEHGFGPWALLVDGAFAGWGGFEFEEDGADGVVADFALVLLPAYWGHGAAITRRALQAGFEELGIDVVTIALPFTRRPTRVVARLGFEPDGTVVYGDAEFQRYRLNRERWSAENASSARSCLRASNWFGVRDASRGARALLYADLGDGADQNP